MSELGRRGLLIGSGLVLPSVAAAAGRAPAKVQPATQARLAVTENPFGPSRPARAAIIASVSEAPYYVEDESELRKIVAQREGVSDTNVALSSGSLDALSLLTTDIAHGGHVIAPLPSYVTHLAYAARRGVPTHYVPLTADHDIDLDAMAKLVSADTRLVYLPNPNNPTGKLLDPARLKAFCAEISKTVPVIIDEAYFELAPDAATHTVAPLVQQGHDVIVTRTFSKVYGLAGLRIAYILAQPARVKQLYSLATTSRNQAGIAAAKASLGDAAYLAGAIDYLKTCRAKIYAICKTNKLDYIESQGTFVYVNTRRPALKIQKALADRGVFVRVFDSPNYANWIRIGTATPAELDYFASVLPEALAASEKL